MQLIWSDFAIENLKQIFDYYKARAGEKVAHKIRRQILEATKQLHSNPESGQIEFNLESLKQNYRYILSGSYKVIYRINKDVIFINDVFDVRQNPTKMMDEDRYNIK
ncbi:MAG: type II toxin-antitoxin system RelE/ParE family toxin [Aequorivita sp.]